MKNVWTDTACYSSAIDQISSGVSSLKLTGLAGSAAPSFVAELSNQTHRPFLVVVKNAEEAVRWWRDMKFFLSEPGEEMLSGSSDTREPGVRAEVAGRAILFPEFRDGVTDPKESGIIFSAHLNASLHSLRSHDVPVAIAPASFMAVRLDAPEHYSETGIDITTEGRTNIRRIIEQLTEMGYERVMRVESPGDFAFRGGILDIFIPVYNFPVRVEYFGDEVISIREFDPLTQRSISRVRMIRITRALDQGGAADSAPFFFRILEWLGKDVVTVWIEPDEVLEELRRIDATSFRTTTLNALPGTPSILWDDIEDVSVDSSNIVITAGSVPEFNGDYRKITNEFRRWSLEGYRIMIVYRRESVRRVVSERLAAADLDRDEDAQPSQLAAAAVGQLPGNITTEFIAGDLSRGFRLPDSHCLLLTERDIVGQKRPQRWKRSDEFEQGLSFRDLHPGDLVVHVDHGIGRYDGLHRLSVNGKEQDFLLVRYAEDQKLYLPVDRLYLIQRYIATSDARPALDRMGGVTWKSKKRKVKESVLQLAAELLKLFSEREVVTGFSFPSDDNWQREFELGFDYEETPDQLKAINDVKSDMETPRPMDRIVCGDVGYGKTEVALRAAFKAAIAGKQVAVLVPTTILAQQHFRSFQKRFENFPVKIAMLSRFLKDRDRKIVHRHIADGTIDIVIGTHALLGDLVRFQNLGLLIIDEEHRFGVRHKEKLKQLRNTIDVLTLTATPIPRTLNMSLLGLREISLINTPPESRLPIMTRIARFDRELIRRAVLEELSRGGQVYFVHNRVHSIHVLADMLRKLVPEARIGVGHGQMSESALESVMLRFLEREYDVLVCTTIIESGLDIPSVNTIIINRADQLGLAQLYQLRGRVGRDRYQAYAWLLVPATQIVTQKAKERLSAIREAVELGSGFSLSARDLDIRGAGDILGPNQHGQISAVGFEMYCRLIREAVQELKGEQIEETRECEIKIPYDLAIPEMYIEEPAFRLEVYRRFSTIRYTDQIESFVLSLKDQYGDPPEAIYILADIAGIRIAAAKLAVTLLEYRKGVVVATFSNSTPLKPEHVMELIVRQPQRYQFNPPVSLMIRVSETIGRELVRKTRYALEEMVAMC
ncbi:transcription-repair coupling factor [bacterium]|nr:transcription-repair coupling factor [candidate division CSSED10-310 bacterium]